jgi:hypothetical protein
MRNMLRDNTRDAFTRDLCAIGVKAVIAERGREEEKIRSGSKWLKQRSLGVIDVQEGAVKWINVVRLKSRDSRGPAVH